MSLTGPNADGQMWMATGSDVHGRLSPDDKFVVKGAAKKDALNVKGDKK